MDDVHVDPSKANDGLMRTKCKRIASAITPSKIHGGWFKICPPGIVDVLADVVEDIVDRHNLNLTRGQQEAISEQCHLLTLRKVREVFASGNLHHVASVFSHQVLDLIEIYDDQDPSRPA